MDDIFDSLIYIIVAIVAFAISILGKKKKKDVRTVSPVDNENSGEREERPLLSNIAQLLNEELGIQNQNFDKYEYETEAESEEKPDVYEKEEILDSVPPEMLDNKEDAPYSIEYEDTSEVFSDSIKDTDISEEDKTPIIEDFNLRDAVIYSEIINRKEF
ncbi:MAG: hypothetical protein K8R31_14235 [Bacteroidales bacterium]|nr:hypothetical protein [Bacteroidales bacterium]